MTLEIPSDDEARRVAAPQLRRAPAERAARAVLPVCAGVWTAAEVMHATGVPWVDVGAGALGATALAGLTGHRATAGGLILAGGWAALATRTGPLADPHLYFPATTAFLASSLYAWRWARSHPKVVAARDKRNARADWLDKRNRWGLPGSHLQDWRRTRLGEWYLVDTKQTGRRASAFVHGDTAERIAEQLNLPVSRVRISRHGIAGRIEISIRYIDPWAKPIPHPLFADVPVLGEDDKPLDLSRPYSIRQPAIVGQDPETGRPLALSLCDERGGKNVSIVGIKGAGKTVLLSDISERVTAAPDAILIRVNLSVKGDAEASMWAPACHLTALGRQQAGRAVAVLRAINGVIEWRSRQPRETADFVPSRKNPLVVLIVDEQGSATQHPEVRRELRGIATTGREFGITIVTADQRGTADRQGGSDIRSQQDVFCLGMVNRGAEAMHAAGDLGLAMPNMAEYGEGRAGVWVIAELGGDQQAGRTFNLKDPVDIRRIAAERARQQPELPPELRAHLGDAYAKLLATDVFAQWANGHDGPPAPGTTPPPSAPIPPGNALDPAAAPVGVLTADPLTALDGELNAVVPDELRGRWYRQGEDLARIRAELARIPEPDMSGISPDQAAKYAEAQWKALGEAAEIPAEHLEPLLRLLAAGTTIGEVASTLGVSKWTARTYLERLRGEGRVRIEGSGRGARWKSESGGVADD